MKIMKEAGLDGNFEGRYVSELRLVMLASNVVADVSVL